MYGLGNIVENAVDHARNTIEITLFWDEDKVGVSINDDGRGFPEEMIEKIGEPFVTRRGASLDREGLGLGLFIAKTLLERSGGSLVFTNNAKDGLPGAVVQIEWARDSIDKTPALADSIKPDQT